MAIFLAQFVTVYLLGVQSLNVRDGNYVGAAVTSVALGCSGYYLAAAVGRCLVFGPVVGLHRRRPGGDLLSNQNAPTSDPGAAQAWRLRWQQQTTS